MRQAASSNQRDDGKWLVHVDGSRLIRVPLDDHAELEDGATVTRTSDVLCAVRHDSLLVSCWQAMSTSLLFTLSAA